MVFVFHDRQVVKKFVGNNANSATLGHHTTGAGKTPNSSTKHLAVGVPATTSKGRVMDGFFAKKPAKSTVKNLASKAKTGVAEVAKPAEVAASVRQTAKTMHRGAQRSKTLMRSAVTKPITVRPKTNSFFVNGKTHAQKIDNKRAAKAKTIEKNAKVKRFGLFSSQNAVTQSQQSQPQAPSTQAVTAKAAPVTKNQQQVLPSMVTSASHHQIERLLDHALHRADAHKKALRGNIPGRSRWQRIFDAPKWLSIGSACLAIALIAAFFAWQNVPQVSMRLATTKSNVNASVPDYTPPGFSFTGPIQYSEQQVTMDFKANADPTRTYKLVQESSAETSKSLAANTLANDDSVQTSQVNGNTVYIYGENNHATWVNGGVRYTIEDKAKLDTEQILKIAGSLHQ